MLTVVKYVLQSRSPCLKSIPILIGCVTLRKLLNLSKPWFPHLYNGCKNRAYCNRVCDWIL